MAHVSSNLFQARCWLPVWTLVGGVHILLLVGCTKENGSAAPAESTPTAGQPAHAAGPGQDDLSLSDPADGVIQVHALSGEGEPLSSGVVVADGVRTYPLRDGRAVVRPVYPGSHQVTLRAVGHAEVTSPAVHVSRGETVEVTLRAGEAAPPRGVVLDAEGRPIAHLPVYLFQPRRLGSVDLERVRTRVAAGDEPAGLIESRTGREGRFELAGARPGEGVILAFPPDHAPIARRVGLPLASPLEIRATRSASLVVEMSRPDGSAASGEVSLWARTGLLWMTRSTGDGCARFERLPADDWSVTIQPDTGKAKLLEVSLSPGEARRLEVECVPVRTARFRVFHRGRPVSEPGVHLVPWPGDETPEVMERMGTAGPGVSGGPDGRAAIRRVEPGRYGIEVRRQVGTRGSVRVSVGTRRLGEPGDPEIELHLPEAVLAGTVVDASTGAPVPDAHVELRGGGPPERDAAMGFTRTAGDGTFRVDGLPPGAYRLWVRSPTHLEARGEGEARVDGALGAVESRIVLNPGVPMTGTVRDTEGRPVPGAWVRARSEGDRSRLRRTRTGPGGHYEFRLRPGSYEVRVRAPGFGRARVGPLQIGAPRSRDFELAPAGSLVVVTEEREGLRLAVDLLQPDGTPVRRKAGRSPVHLDDIAPGPHRVRVRRYDGQNLRAGPAIEREARIVSGRTCRIRVPVPQDGSVGRSGSSR